MMVEIDGCVYFIHMNHWDNDEEMVKGSVLYLDLKGNGEGYIVFKDKVYDLSHFGTDKIEDFGGKVNKEKETEKDSW